MHRFFGISVLALAAALPAAVLAQAAPGNDTVLGFVSTNLAKGPDNFYTYYRFSTQRVQFRRGDVLVYDVYLDPKSPALKGGIDVDLDSSVSLRDHHLVDQNGIPAHGDGILTPAAGKWYTRRIALDKIAGHTSEAWTLVFEGDKDGRYAQFVDNVFVQRADGSRVDVYRDGPPPASELEGTNGYSSQPFLAAIPRAEVRDGDPSAAVAEVEEIGARLNAVEGLRRSVALAQAATKNGAFASDLHALETATAGSRAEYEREYAAVVKRLEAASPLLKSYVGDLVGYAHTDVQWLWEWPEARLAVFQTWRQALRFMDQYPNFTFSQSTSGYYQAMEETYPDLFKKVQRRVREGRWEIVGGRICEADENLLSPEAHARQFLYAQRYFREKFGRIATVGWEPDTFGHTAQMPQILKLGGCDSYYFCRGGKDQPLFWWEALDGTKVLTFDEVASGSWYNGPLDENTPKELIPWQQKTGRKEMMWVYGVGNHGGGPTKENIETALKWQKQPFQPTAKFSTATQFFADMRKGDLSRIPTLQTELEGVFNGCYTSQARMKLLNDQAEAATTTAEAVAAAASTFGFPYPGKEFRKNWETIGFNQHHDTICGSSFHWSYLKTLPELTGVIASDKVYARQALEFMTSRVSARAGGTTLMVFNPVGWRRSGWVDGYVADAPLASSSFVAVAPDGQEVPAYVTDAQTGAVRFYAKDLPAFGYSVYLLKAGSPAAEDLRMDVHDVAHLENRTLRATLDLHRGCVTSLIDKRTGRELAGAKGLGLLENHLEAPSPDAWNLQPIVRVDTLAPVQFDAHQEPGNVVVAFDYVLTDPEGRPSKIRQTFRLGANEDHLDVSIDCDWRALGNPQHPSPLLRAAFDVAAEHPAATYEVPFGAVGRPTDGQEAPVQNWADVSDSQGGVTIAEVGKHGFSCTGATLRMSLIRSYDHPDTEPNEGLQHWEYQIVPHPGDWHAAEGAQRAAELAQPLLGVVVPPDSKGDAPMTWSAATLAGKGLVPTCLKKSEDDGDLVIRAYESLGAASNGTITAWSPLASARLVNFLEDPLGLAPVQAGKVPLAFRPFEIKTVKLHAGK